MRALVLKEIRSFFSSLLGYTVVGVFLLFSGLFLWLFLEDGTFLTVAWRPWTRSWVGAMGDDVPRPCHHDALVCRRTSGRNTGAPLTRPLTEGQVVVAKFWELGGVFGVAPSDGVLCVGGGDARATGLELGHGRGGRVVHRTCGLFRRADRHWVGGVKLHNATVVAFLAGV